MRLSRDGLRGRGNTALSFTFSTVMILELDLVLGLVLGTALDLAWEVEFLSRQHASWHQHIYKTLLPAQLD